jgi:hypothetical protein
MVLLSLLFVFVPGYFVRGHVSPPNVVESILAALGL